jgi:hypothetical protein
VGHRAADLRRHHQGKIDHWVIGPVQSPDEDFHQSITKFLGEWRSERGGFEAVQVIGSFLLTGAAGLAKGLIRPAAAKED